MVLECFQADRVLTPFSCFALRFCEQIEDDNVTYTFWEGMKWPPVHNKTAR